LFNKKGLAQRSTLSRAAASRTTATTLSDTTQEELDAENELGQCLTDLGVATAELGSVGVGGTTGIGSAALTLVEGAAVEIAGE